MSDEPQSAENDQRVYYNDVDQRPFGYLESFANIYSTWEARSQRGLLDYLQIRTSGEDVQLDQDPKFLERIVDLVQDDIAAGDSIELGTMPLLERHFRGVTPEEVIALNEYSQRKMFIRMLTELQRLEMGNARTVSDAHYLTYRQSNELYTPLEIQIWVEDVEGGQRTYIRFIDSNPFTSDVEPLGINPVIISYFTARNDNDAIAYDAPLEEDAMTDLRLYQDDEEYVTGLGFTDREVPFQIPQEASLLSRLIILPADLIPHIGQSMDYRRPHNRR